MKEWEALNEKVKKEDPMYEPVRLVEWLDAREAEERRLREEAEEAALMDRELRSSNDQLCAWRERQRLKLTCRSSGDALAILLHAANTAALARRAHLQRRKKEGSEVKCPLSAPFLSFFLSFFSFFLSFTHSLTTTTTDINQQ